MTSLAFLPFKRYLMSFIFLCFIFYFSFLLINNTPIPWQKQLTAWHGDKEVSCSVPQRNRIEPMLPNCAEIKEPWRWLGEWCCCLQFCKIPSECSKKWISTEKIAEVLNINRNCVWDDEPGECPSNHRIQIAYFFPTKIAVIRSRNHWNKNCWKGKKSKISHS